MLRKAPYMYGWDIMPRIVSAGLWKSVEVEYLPKNRIGEFYLICWQGDQCGTNHFTAAIGDGIQLDSYSAYMKEADF